MVFLAPILFLVLGSVSFVEGKKISDLTYELITEEIGGVKYTPYCLSECHMPIRFKSDKEININQFDNDKNWFDTRESTKTLNTKSFNKLNFMILDTENYEDKISNVSCNPFEHMNANGTFTNQNCTETFLTVSKTRDIWKPLNALGKKFLADKLYIIDVVGSRQAQMGIHGIDIIPKVAGKELMDLAWWNSTWQRKVPITVTTQATRNGYELYINLTYNSNMVSDFSDIRFVNASENEELPFYLYAKSNSNWAEFYIKGNWSVNNGTQLYVYYSNNTPVSSASNGNNTFLFYDEFNGASLDTTKWLENGCWNSGSGSTSVSGGILTITSTATSRCVTTKKDFGLNTMAECVTKRAADNTHLCSFFNQTNTSAILRFRTDNAQANFYTTDGANTDTAWPAKDTNYHKYQVYRFDATKTAFWQNTTTRNSTGGTGRPAHPLPILLGTDTGVTGSNVLGDYVIVRNYFEPSPVYSVGVEQAPAPPQSFLNSTNSTLANTNVKFSLNWTAGDGDLSSYKFSWTNGANWTINNHTSDLESGTIQNLYNTLSTIMYEPANAISVNWDNTVDGDWTATTTSAINGTSFRDIGTGASKLGSKSTLTNTTGFSNINVTFTWNTANLDLNENISFDWYDNTAWTRLKSYDGATLTERFTLGNTANNNPNLRLNFTCTHNAGASEACIFDDIFLFGYSINQNTSYTTYSNVFKGDLPDQLTNITVTVNTTTYNNTGSSSSGTSNPDLWLEMFDGTNWIEIGNMSVAGTGNTSKSTQNNGLLTAWLNPSNRDLRIKGRYIDSPDEIDYTDMWVLINSNGQFLNDTSVAFSGVGNWSNVTKTVNSTVGSTIQWKVYANDTFNTWNVSQVFSFITTAPPTHFGSASVSLLLSSSNLDLNQWFRFRPENILTLSTPSRLVSWFRSNTNNILFSSSPIKIVILLRDVSNSILLYGSNTMNHIFNRMATANILLSSSIDRLLFSFRTNSANIILSARNLHEIILSQITYFRNNVENIIIASSNTRHILWLRINNANILLSSSIERIINSLRDASNSILLFLNNERYLLGKRFSVENILLSQSNFRQGLYKRFSNAVAVLGSSADRIQSSFRDMSNSIILNASQIKGRVISRINIQSLIISAKEVKSRLLFGLTSAWFTVESAVQRTLGGQQVIYIIRTLERGLGSRPYWLAGLVVMAISIFLPREQSKAVERPKGYFER